MLLKSASLTACFLLMMSCTTMDASGQELFGPQIGMAHRDALPIIRAPNSTPAGSTSRLSLAPADSARFTDALDAADVDPEMVIYYGGDVDSAMVRYVRENVDPKMILSGRNQEQVSSLVRPGPQGFRADK